MITTFECTSNLRYITDSYWNNRSWIWSLHLHRWWRNGNGCQLDTRGGSLFEIKSNQKCGICFQFSFILPCGPISPTAPLRLWGPSIEPGRYQGRGMLHSLGSFLATNRLSFPWEVETHKDWIRIIRLWLQGDNCPKEVRNSWTGKWACMLSQANYFVGVSHHHMVVGHTHEDIGAFV